VDAADIVLYLHLLSLLLMAVGIVVFGVCFWRLRSARSLDQAVPSVRLIDRAGWAFPVSILGLVATGAYLTFHSWTWSTAWIDASIAGLIVVSLQGFRQAWNVEVERRPETPARAVPQAG